jgi:hypothetical protein
MAVFSKLTLFQNVCKEVGLISVPLDHFLTRKTKLDLQLVISHFGEDTLTDGNLGKSIYKKEIEAALAAAVSAKADGTSGGGGSVQQGTKSIAGVSSGSDSKVASVPDDKESPGASNSYMISWSDAFWKVIREMGLAFVLSIVAAYFLLPGLQAPPKGDT